MPEEQDAGFDVSLPISPDDTPIDLTTDDVTNLPDDVDTLGPVYLSLDPPTQKLTVQEAAEILIEFT